MKKSEFVKKVLKNKNNTVFVTEGQVENAIEVFEKIGMLAPWSNEEFWKDPSQDVSNAYKWEPEND